MSRTSSSNIVSKWLDEYCAPVVACVATAEVESICLKNGLLLHELLSAFGHLDGVNTTIRSSHNPVHVSDAHIRFERITEVKAKTSYTIEELMRASFEDTDMARMPSNAQELKSAMPTAWSPLLEQIITRSASFGEFEMISHPVIILTVVSTSDYDPVACMQELSSTHHSPDSFTNGQYDPDMHRVFLLIHDSHAKNAADPNTMYRRLQSRFPPVHTKMLILNSLPPDAPNLQQPDMWTRTVFPKFFPQFAPTFPEGEQLPRNPLNGDPVIGSRLSMEDFMSLRDFCITLYHQDIVPFLERRIATLTRAFTDARKGVKNVLKSFWRKPREDVGTGSVRYRYDRIEAQMLLLADTCFIVKDYENALNIYRTVKEDFRSDKSTLHLAHCLLMIIACHNVMDPGRRDIVDQVEQLAIVLNNAIEPSHLSAYFALIAGEICQGYGQRGSLEAAHFYLQSGGTATRCALLGGMLTERASACYLSAGQIRKFCLHMVLAGMQIYQCGTKPARHSLIYFASSMMYYEKQNWGSMKCKLLRLIANDVKRNGDEGSKRAFILLLKFLVFAIDGKVNICGQDMTSEAAVVLREIMDNQLYMGSMHLKGDWINMSTYDVLLGTLPIEPLAIEPEKPLVEVVGLRMPEMNNDSLHLMQPLNGYAALVPYGVDHPDLIAAEELRLKLEIEKTWGLEQEGQYKPESTPSSPGRPDRNRMKSLAERQVEAEEEFLEKLRLPGRAGPRVLREDRLQVPLGERVAVQLQLSNRLPTDLMLSDLKLLMSPEETFEMPSVEMSLGAGMTNTTNFLATPYKLGSFKAESVQWNLSDHLTVRQPLSKPGMLLQKSFEQRAQRQRGPEQLLLFDVVPSHPLLQVSFEGLSPEVLQGQLLKATLILWNEGTAPATDIDIKLSQACFTFYIENSASQSQSLDPFVLAKRRTSSTESTMSAPVEAVELVPLWGQSCSVVHLPEGTVVPPGEKLRMSAWLRIGDLGRQKISVLAMYNALRENGASESFGPNKRCRTSFVSIETTVIPSVSLSVKSVGRTSSSSSRSMLVEVKNHIKRVEDEPSANPLQDTRVRNSSVGQIEFDIGGFGAEGNVEEGTLKIEGVQIYGAAMPSTSSSTYQGLALPSNETALLHASVTYKHDSSVQTEPAQTQESRAGVRKKSWAIPLSASVADMAKTSGGSRVQSRNLLESILERFLCIGRATSILHSKLVAAFHNLELQRIEENRGPRSISAVRRERQADDAAASADSSKGFTDTPGANGTSASASCKGVPERICDLAQIEMKSNTVTVAVVWTVRWNEKVRIGMHYVMNVPVVEAENNVREPSRIPPPSPSAYDVRKTRAPTASGGSSIPAEVRSKASVADMLLTLASDAFLVSITHPSAVKIPTTVTGHRIPCASASVTVELRSVSPHAIVVSVEAMDRRNASQALLSDTSSDQSQTPTSKTERTSSRGSETRSPSASASAKAEATARAPKGMRWEGKTKHSLVALQPYKTTKLVFRATFTRTGIFDLQKFLISAEYSSKHESGRSMQSKRLSEQSLIEVSQ